MGMGGARFVCLFVCLREGGRLMVDGDVDEGGEW